MTKGDYSMSKSFLTSLKDSWANAWVNMVTFGTGSSGGAFSGYTGAQALAQMHNLGSDVGMLKKQGFSSFDAVHQSWNQYVGSVYHYHAVDNFQAAAQYFRPTAIISGQDWKSFNKYFRKFETVFWDQTWKKEYDGIISEKDMFVLVRHSKEDAHQTLEGTLRGISSDAMNALILKGGLGSRSLSDLKSSIKQFMVESGMKTESVFPIETASSFGSDEPIFSAGANYYKTYSFCPSKASSNF